jgi:3-hydroxyisobutyrate dehydrogenase
MDSRLRIGFVGVGDMGGPIVSRIAAAGFPTAVWARRPESLTQFADQPAVRTAPSLAALAAASDVVGICVFADDDVKGVACELIPAAAPGTVLLIHSTVSVPTCRELAELAAARGVVVLDAPVTGARAGAVQGTLSVMVGGPAPAVERVRPVLGSFTAIVCHLGPVGSGQMMKTLNNALSNSNGRLAVLAIEVGRDLGLDPHQVIAVLRSGGAASASLNSIADRLLPDPEFAAHAARMIAKDAALFTEVRAATGLPESLLEVLARERADHVVPVLGT